MHLAVLAAHPDVHLTGPPCEMCRRLLKFKKLGPPLFYSLRLGLPLML